MGEISEGAVDLLGDPWTEERDPRGRKRHKRTKQIAETVAFLRAAGSSVEQIAARVILDEKTLRKYYSRELDKGPDLARQVLIERMWAKAMDGNVAAARFMREELVRGEARQAEETIQGRGRQPALGKKEEQQLAAERVGGKYAPPAAPKLVVSNPR